MTDQVAEVENDLPGRRWKMQFYTKTAVFAFLSPRLGVRTLGAMYDVHSRLTGKLIVDFLLELIELFLLIVTSEALRANIDFD